MFRIWKMPGSLRFLLVRTIRFPARVSLSRTVAVPSGGTLATPKANRILRGAFATASSPSWPKRRGTNAKRSMGLLHGMPCSEARLHWTRGRHAEPGARDRCLRIYDHDIGRRRRHAAIRRLDGVSTVRLEVQIRPIYLIRIN